MSPRASASSPALAEPYTKLLRRGRWAATVDSTTRHPCPWARRPAAAAMQAAAPAT